MLAEMAAAAVGRLLTPLRQPLQPAMQQEATATARRLMTGTAALRPWRRRGCWNWQGRAEASGRTLNDLRAKCDPLWMDKYSPLPSLCLVSSRTAHWRRLPRMR